MSNINKKLWSAYITGDPPPDCTYEQLCAARDFIWNKEDKEFLLNYIKSLEKLLNSENELVAEYANKEIIKALEELYELAG